ncbi:MAG: VWA domain-containing protein, partial [Acutalibacteraceae bacterium]
MKYKFKDKLMKVLVMILSVGTLWLTTGNVSLAYNVDDTMPQWDKPGSLRLSKTAVPTDKDDEWKIELTVEGKDYPTTTDVVLVVDTSNSMNYDISGEQIGYSSRTRLKYVKTAAVQFAENILTEENVATHRMAIVTFAENSNVVCDFTTSTNTLKRYINNIQANGGTNMQAGLYQAKKLLEKSTADNKVIVILGDGKPTFCYEISSSKGISIDHETHKPVFETGYTLTYNTAKYIGKGNASDCENLYTLTCTECGKSYAVYNDVIEPTLYEADTIKKSNIEIYSIAFGADSVGTSTLKSISSNTSETSSFFTEISSSVSQSQVQAILNDTFKHIASSILSAAKDSVVTDPMGEMFDLVAPNGAADITVEITDTKTQTTETFKG